MKLLFIIPEYPPCSGGGIATFYKHLLPQLAKQGHQVHVIAGNAFTPTHQAYQTEGVTVEFLDPDQVNAYRNRFDRYQATPELQRHLAAAWVAWDQSQGGKDYDLVETTDWGLLFAPWIVSQDSPPTVVQLHASIGQIDAYDPKPDSLLQSSLTQLLEVGLLSAADELQTYSQANGQAWQQLLGRDVTYVPPALPVEMSSLPGIEKKSAATGLVVGRIQYWKGPTVLCEALRELGHDAPVVDWVGRDLVHQQSGKAMSAYLQETYPDIWGVKVRPIGMRPCQDVVALQAQARFLLVPSIWDVFNYTCVEGMAQAQTVICSQGAGAADWITDHKNGLRFESNDAKALADKLYTCLTLSDSEQQQMRQSAVETVRTYLNPATIAQKRIELYQQRIHQGKAATRPNDWLQSAVMPQTSKTKTMAYLDQLPLRDLSSYLLHRGMNQAGVAFNNSLKGRNLPKMNFIDTLQVR